MNWVYGPAEADLGKYAKIFVPAGYQFANAQDARGLLKRMNNPVPAALAGLLTSPMSRGIIVFEFTETGYIRDTGEESLDPAAILNKLEKKVAIQNQQTAKSGNPNMISTVEWAIQPEYNRDDHLLEWSIRADNGSGQTVNHVVRLLGREGVLDGIAVQPHQLGIEPIPLRRLMLGVAFKAGHTYADYRKGDRVAHESLADTITADESEQPVDTHRLGVTLASIGAGMVLLGAGGWTVRRKFKERAEKKNARVSTAPLAHGPLVHANGNGNGNGQSVSINGNGNGVTNGKVNGHHKARRRRVFNYQKYYSDLLFQVSDRAIEVDYVAPGTFQNGTSRPNGTVHADKTLDANLGLIENQKTLIEEQQRLIREQTKLIEEKTRLIQEKNQVLEKQAELFGNNVF